MTCRCHITVNSSRKLNGYLSGKASISNKKKQNTGSVFNSLVRNPLLLPLWCIFTQSLTFLRCFAFVPSLLKLPPEGNTISSNTSKQKYLF